MSFDEWPGKGPAAGTEVDKSLARLLELQGSGKLVWKIIGVNLAASAALGIGWLMVMFGMFRGNPDPDLLWWALLLAGLPWLLCVLLLMVLSLRLTTSLIELATNRDIDGDGVIGPSGEPAQNVNIVRVHGGAIIEGTPDVDLAYFIIVSTANKKWTQDMWRGQRLPSGRTCQNIEHAKMMKALKAAGIVVDHKPGSTGEWVEEDAYAAARLCGVSQGSFEQARAFFMSNVGLLDANPPTQLTRPTQQKTVQQFSFTTRSRVTHAAALRALNPPEER